MGRKRKVFTPPKPPRVYGPRLTVEQVRYVQMEWRTRSRTFWRKVADTWGVHIVTLRRIGVGITWKEAYANTRSDDSKPCPVCKKFISRRDKHGVHKGPVRWAKQTTCGSHCAMLLRHARDGFTRPATRAAKINETSQVLLPEREADL